MEAAVTWGFSGGSGDMLRRGDLDSEGDLMLTELARRGGATPLTECEWSEFREAFLSRVGVAERESRPFDDEGPLRGVRGAALDLTLRELGDRLRGGLKGPPGLGERGDFAGEDAERES